jgi:hypothetical protein
MTETTSMEMAVHRLVISKQMESAIWLQIEATALFVLQKNMQTACTQLA